MADNLFKPFHIKENQLASYSKKAGQIFFCSDTGNIYLDETNASRIQISKDKLSQLEEDANHKFVSQTEKNNWNNKASNGHTHHLNDVIRTGSTAGSIFENDRGTFDFARSCKTAFLPAEAIEVEYTNDNGRTWHPYSLSNIEKQGLFSVNREKWITLGGPQVSQQAIGNGVRITITPIDRYVFVNTFYCWFTTSGSQNRLKIERSTIGEPNTFAVVQEDIRVDGWSGPNEIFISPGTFGGGSTQYSNYYKYRFTFMTIGIHDSYTYTPQVADLRLYGPNAWQSANSMMSTDHLYSWDSNQNVVFPKNLQAESLQGPIKNGNYCTTVDFGSANINNPSYFTVWGPNGESLRTIKSADVPAAINLGAVENKSSTDIRNEITSHNVTSALGYTPIQNFTAKATIDNKVGIPNVVVSKSGTNANPEYSFSFQNIKGESGKNGVSPVVSVGSTVAGHTVTVTDAQGSHQFTVSDGQDGLPGQPGPRGEKGAKGDPGQDGKDAGANTIMVQSAQPTNPECKIWIQI